MKSYNLHCSYERPNYKNTCLTKSSDMIEWHLEACDNVKLNSYKREENKKYLPLEHFINMLPNTKVVSISSFTV